MVKFVPDFLISKTGTTVLLRQRWSYSLNVLLAFRGFFEGDVC